MFQYFYLFLCRAALYDVKSLSVMKDESLVYLLLNSRRWYEMQDDNEINFVMDQDGKVSKIRASSILEMDQKQIEKMLSLKDDPKALNNYIASMKVIKKIALSKFKHKALALAWRQV